jgi:hypothetical protein
MESMTMNHYGAMAQQHWQKVRAEEYALIEDPERFFSELGEQVAEMVQQRMDQLLETQPRAEGFVAELARQQTARGTAEDETLRTMVFTDPGSDTTSMTTLA